MANPPWVGGRDRWPLARSPRWAESLCSTPATERHKEGLCLGKDRERERRYGGLVTDESRREDEPETEREMKQKGERRDGERQMGEKEGGRGMDGGQMEVLRRNF